MSQLTAEVLNGTVFKGVTLAFDVCGKGEGAGSGRSGPSGGIWAESDLSCHLVDYSGQMRLHSLTLSTKGIRMKQSKV